MLKKGLLVLALMAFAMGGVFAQINLSAGAGAYFTSDFGGGLKSSESGGEFTMKWPYFGGGGFVFLDATYAELSVGFAYTVSTVEMEEKSGGQSYSGNVDSSAMSLDIGLLGKYPIAISNELTVFPLLGVSYRLVLSGKFDGKTMKKDETGFDPGDLSALWFKAGGGLDYSFTDSIYLRGALTYGIRLANKAEKDANKNQFNDKADTRLGHGLDAKVAVGYRF